MRFKKFLRSLDRNAQSILEYFILLTVVFSFVIIGGKFFMPAFETMKDTQTEATVRNMTPSTVFDTP